MPSPTKPHLQPRDPIKRTDETNSLAEFLSSTGPTVKTKMSLTEIITTEMIQSLDRPFKSKKSPFSSVDGRRIPRKSPQSLEQMFSSPTDSSISAASRDKSLPRIVTHASTQVMPAKQAVETQVITDAIESGCQSEMIEMVESGCQSEMVALVESGCQSDVIEMVESGCQSEMVALVETGCQYDIEPVILETAESACQYDLETVIEKQVEMTETGCQYDLDVKTGMDQNLDLQQQILALQAALEAEKARSNELLKLKELAESRFEQLARAAHRKLTQSKQPGL